MNRISPYVLMINACNTTDAMMNGFATQQYCCLNEQSRGRHVSTTTTTTRHRVVVIKANTVKDTVVSEQYVTDKIFECITDILGDNISADQPLMEAGLDSLGARVAASLLRTLCLKIEKRIEIS